MSETHPQDDRLTVFEQTLTMQPVPAIRIQKIRLSHYRFFTNTQELDLLGKNLLIFGENGTGKSSLFCAFKLLAGLGLEQLEQESNLFTGSPPEIEFDFSTGQTLNLNPENTERPQGFDFLNPLSVFLPLLDYKRLLRLHYSADASSQKINIYGMLRELFKDYPVENRNLGEIDDFLDYFDHLKRILHGPLLNEINDMLRVFDPNFTLQAFRFETPMNSSGSPDPLVRIEIDYHENSVERYHSFLNEARLSAMAISVYLASIKHLLGTLPSSALRILVLDDILISLDMTNRRRLLDILRTHFNDFQICFFTHDKSLFELYRDKLNWACYEFYSDDHEPHPTVFIKQGKTELEQARMHFAKREYEPCALFLRKGFEKLLKNWLPQHAQRNRNYVELDLAALTSKAISLSSGDARTILERLNTDRSHILNPLCHSDTRNIHSPELKSAMEDLENLRTELTAS